VEQQDILAEGSTPRELFEFVLRVKSSLNSEQRTLKIDKLINTLGLVDC